MAQSRPAIADSFTTRLALFYAGFFVSAGIQMPFFPAWLAAKGLDSSAIGVVLTAPIVVRVLAVPAVTRLADRSGTVHRVLAATALASVAGYALVGLAQSFLAILALVALASIALAPIMPLADAYALRGLHMRRKAYGPVRLWGSVAFIAANMGGGLALDLIARANLIWLTVAGLAATAAAACTLAPIGPDASVQPPDTPKSPSGRLPVFLAVTAAASLVQASHAVYYAFSTLEWSSSLDGTAIGALWALGVLAEIVLFAISGRLPRSIGPLTLLMLGAVGGVVRWGAMALDPPLVLLPLLQCLHALSFGATHLGAVQFLAHAMADRQAAAQGDFATIVGIVGAGSMSLSGALHGAYGTHAYAAMAAFAGAGGLFVLLARRLGRNEES
jgi:PPP family 3-phenylpropionic acid transporter